MLREFEVPLVMSGHRHDGAGSVAHQNIIGNPNRRLLPVHRINGMTPGKDSRFLFRQIGAIEITLASGLCDVGFNFLSLGGCGQFWDEGMLRRQYHISCSEKGVRPRCEHFQFGIGKTIDRQKRSRLLRFDRSMPPVASWSIPANRGREGAQGGGPRGRLCEGPTA